MKTMLYCYLTAQVSKNRLTSKAIKQNSTFRAKPAKVVRLRSTHSRRVNRSFYYYLYVQTFDQGVEGGIITGNYSKEVRYCIKLIKGKVIRVQLGGGEGRVFKKRVINRLQVDKAITENNEIHCQKMNNVCKFYLKILYIVCEYYI